MSAYLRPVDVRISEPVGSFWGGLWAGSEMLLRTTGRLVPEVSLNSHDIRIARDTGVSLCLSTPIGFQLGAGRPVPEESQKGQDISEFKEALTPTATVCGIQTDRTDITRYILASINLCWTTRMTFKSYFFILNSSGSGKTFSALKVCREMNSIFTFASKFTHIGATPEVSTFMKMIAEAGSQAAKNAVATAFVRLLEKCLISTRGQDGRSFDLQFRGNNYLGMASLLESAFDDYIDFGTLLHEQIKKDSPITGKRTTAANGIIGRKLPIDEEPARLLAEQVLEELKRSVPDGFAINKRQFTDPFGDNPVSVGTDFIGVVFFDEASGLLGNRSIDDEHCALRCLQRALNESDIIGVFLCTTSKLECLESYVPSSRVITCSHAMAPLIRITAHDLFTDHVFHYGRPLWRQWWKHHGKGNYNDLVKFAMSKLTDNRTTVNALKMAACSLFCLRFGFEAVDESCSEFVSDYLAVMTDISGVENGKRIARCRWMSEPVLAEASACLTMGILVEAADDKYRINTVVHHIAEALTTKNIIGLNVRDKGEVSIAAMLGYTMDCIRAQAIANVKTKMYDAQGIVLNMSCIVPAFTFLVGLGIKDVPAESLAGYYFNFTHFQRLGGDASENDCYAAFARRAAYYVTSGAVGVDIVLVGCKKVSESHACFLPVRIQVKNRVQKVTRAAAEILLAAMSPESFCQPHLTGSELEIGIVFAVGTGGADFQDEPICKPAVRHGYELRSEKQVKPKPYYGFLFGNNNINSFSILRHQYPGVVECLTQISQLHAQVEENSFYGEGGCLYVKSVRILCHFY
jgi:hypothetical protein